MLVPTAARPAPPPDGPRGWFRSLIGPAQTRNAVHGPDRYAREQWKRDLEALKRHTRDRRARRNHPVA